jgi:DNA-directed RNA polymerase specialized sigma24 family protein
MGVIRVNPRRSSRRNGRAQRVYDTLIAFADTRERLARLPDDLRLPLSMVMLDGMSYADAARRLDVPEETLMDRLAAARQCLGAMLNRAMRAPSL